MRKLEKTLSLWRSECHVWGFVTLGYFNRFKSLQKNPLSLVSTESWDKLQPYGGVFCLSLENATKTSKNHMIDSYGVEAL